MKYQLFNYTSCRIFVSSKVRKPFEVPRQSHIVISQYDYENLKLPLTFGINVVELHD